MGAWGAFSFLTSLATAALLPRSSLGAEAATGAGAGGRYRSSQRGSSSGIRSPRPGSAVEVASLTPLQS